MSKRDGQFLSSFFLSFVINLCSKSDIRKEDKGGEYNEVALREGEIKEDKRTGSRLGDSGTESRGGRTVRV